MANTNHGNRTPQEGNTLKEHATQSYHTHVRIHIMQHNWIVKLRFINKYAGKLDIKVSMDIKVR